MATSDPYEIKDLPTRSMTAKQLAHTLMYNAPSRGWANYDGMDETLRIAINIAEAKQSDVGTDGMIEQYGSATITSEMKGLRAALNILAKQGPEGLGHLDKQALRTGNLTVSGMIQQSLIMMDAHIPGAKQDRIAEEFLAEGSEEYWESRIKALSRTTSSAESDRNTYSSSKQFVHYLADVQKVISKICHDLGCPEITQRQR
jgi:hypothetical protein